MYFDNRTNQQILKNIEKDKQDNCTWDRTLKYLEKKNIPYEYAFSVVADELGNIKGFPLFLLFSKKIKEFDFIYNGLSLAVLFEMYNFSNKKSNLIVQDGGSYSVDSNQLNPYLVYKILTKIKNKDILEQVIKENINAITEPIQATEDSRSYSDHYANYVDFFLCNKQFDIVNMILFELNLSSENIQKILNGWDERSNNLVYSLFRYNQVDILTKLDEKYSINWNIDLPMGWSYHFTPLSFYALFDYTSDSYSKNKIVKKQLIDFMIDKKIDFIPNEFLTGKNSSDSQMDKMFNRDKTDNEKKGYTRTYFYYANDTLQRTLHEKYFREAIDYYLSSCSDTDKFFWTILFLNEERGLKLLEKHKDSFNSFQKDYLFNRACQKIYNKDVVSFFFNHFPEFKENINKKFKYERTLIADIAIESNDEREDKNKIYQIFEVLLLNGARINDVTARNENLSSIGLFNKDFYKPLLTKYSNNKESLITFNTNELIGKSQFHYVFEVMKQVKELLIKLNIFTIIDNIYFKDINDGIISFIVNNKIVELNEKDVSGNPVNQNTFKIKG